MRVVLIMTGTSSLATRVAQLIRYNIEVIRKQRCSIVCSLEDAKTHLLIADLLIVDIAQNEACLDLISYIKTQRSLDRLPIIGLCDNTGLDKLILQIAHIRRCFEYPINIIELMRFVDKVIKQTNGPAVFRQKPRRRQ